MIELQKPILNESNEILVCEPYPYSQIEPHLYIVSYLTSAGIQECGLYFKVVRFEDPDNIYAGGKILDLCRISMERPKYITGYNETFKLNDIQKQNMIKILTSPYYDYSAETGWEKILMELDHSTHYSYRINNDPNMHIPYFKNTPMPDYTQL